MTTAAATLAGEAQHYAGPARARWLRAALLSPSGLAAAIVVTALVAVALLAPVLAPFDPVFQQSGAVLLRSSGTHVLGTDEVGRDIASRLLFGMREDIYIVIIAVPIGQMIGVLAGLLSTLHKSTDVLTQRVLDVLVAVPNVILGAALAAFLGPGFRTVLIVIVVGTVPLTARLTRTAVLSQRERDYVRGAQVIGVGRVGVLFRHILPNAMDSLVVNFMLSAAEAVFVEGGLSLLGFGVQPPAPSLGSMIQAGLPFLSQQAWYCLAPVLALTALVIGLNVFANALNRAIRVG